MVFFFEICWVNGVEWLVMKVNVIKKILNEGLGLFECVILSCLSNLLLMVLKVEMLEGGLMLSGINLEIDLLCFVFVEV